MIQKTSPWARRWAHILLPVAFFSALTILITWPLAQQMTEMVYGAPGDNFYFVWLIGWIQNALFQLHTSPLSVPFLNYPEGWNLAYTDIAPSMVALALPASLIAGPTFGYNFAALLSFVLSGLGMYLWVHRLTKNATASLVAGTIFAFAPYRAAHLIGGHLQTMGTQWFPFYFMFLSEFLEARRWVWRPALLAALFLGLIGLTSQYYLYEGLVISCLFIPGFLLLNDRKSIAKPQTWTRLGGRLAVSAPLVLLSALPFLQLAGQGGLLTRGLDSVTTVYSASPTDFLFPPTGHFGWGSLFSSARAAIQTVENNLYLGVPALALSGLAFFKRKQLSEDGRLVKLLVWVGAVSFVLALGTVLHWFSRTVTIQVPQFVQQWFPVPTTFIPLPGYLLLRFAPFYGMMRVWMRYGIFVALFSSVLAGLGSAWIFGRFKWVWTVPIAAILIALIFIDFFPNLGPLYPVKGSPVDEWLASQPGQGIVAVFPSYRMGRGNYYYAASLWNKPMLGGWFGPFLPPQGRRIQPTLSNFPGVASLALLRDWQVQYLIMDKNYYKDDIGNVEAAVERGGYEPRAELNGQIIYERANSVGSEG